MGGIDRVMMFVGPAAGALMFVADSRFYAIAFNSLTFVLSAFLLFPVYKMNLGVKTPRYEFKRKASLLPRIPTFAQNSMVPYLMLGEAFGCLGYGALNILMPIMASKVFQSGEKAYGTLMSFLGAGFVIGIVIAPSCLKKAIPFSVYAGATLVSGLTLYGLGYSERLTFAALLLLGHGVGSGLQEVAAVQAIQGEGHSVETRAEYFSLFQALNSGFILVSLLSFGGLMRSMPVSDATKVAGLIPSVVGFGLIAIAVKKKFLAFQ
jgi:hypothetical protein